MQITLEDLDPYGQGTKDDATGLYESYALPDSHPFNTEPQWRIHRATTDKLPGVLNEESENGRTVHSVHFTGGRDWIVITRKAITPVVTTIKGSIR